MNVTEVNVELCEPEPGSKLRAFASIVFDECFVIHDLKIIEGKRGFHVAMPSRKLKACCPHCHRKNNLLAKYCSECGRQLAEDPVERDQDGRMRLYEDVAHPVTSECRDTIGRSVLDAYAREKERQRTQSVHSASSRPCLFEPAHVRSGPAYPFGVGLL